MNNDKLDKMLKDWDADIELNADNSENIKRNIMENLESPQTIKFNSSEYFHIPKKFAYIAGIAAGLCIAFLAGIQFNKISSEPVVPPEKMISLTSDEVKKLKKISAELDHVFSDDLRWVSQINDEDLDINTGGSENINSKDKVLIRYIVLKKDTGGQQWKKIHVTNLITTPEEQVELKGRDKGYVWVYPADKNVYAVQSQLQLKANGETIDLDYNGGQESRIPQRIKTIQKNNMEYQVYQLVMKI